MLSLIVAAAENGVIGQGNQLPWRLPADLAHFKAITMGKPVVMGRRTWDSIGKPLPERTCIVLTHDPDWHAGGAVAAHSWDEAMAAAQHAGGVEIMVIGGQAVFTHALPLAERIYLTRIHRAYPGDAYFLPLDAARWCEVSAEPHPGDPAFTFLVYEAMTLIGAALD